MAAISSFLFLAAGHVLELAQISENKTHSLFSKVYSRMVPPSRMIIHQLYNEIMK